MSKFEKIYRDIIGKKFCIELDNKIFEYVLDQDFNQKLNELKNNQDKIKSVYMIIGEKKIPYYSNSELNNLYEYNSKLLLEEYDANFRYCLNHRKNNNYEFNIDEDIIIESTYFDDIPQELEDYVILEIERNIAEYNFNIQIPIKRIADILLNSKIKNYKNFHNFLNKLKDNDIGYIEIISCNESNYFAPPIEISKIKIQNEVGSKIEINQMNMLIFDYEKFLQEKTNVCQNMNELYKVLNNEIEYRDSWGEIGINARYFVRDKDQLSIVLDHELGHLISFLIRVSGENHNLCRYWSNYHHNDYDLNDDNFIKNQKAAYLLDSDEFKRWSDTIIQRICKIFKQESTDLSKENILDFYNFILSEIKDQPYQVKNKKNIEIFYNMFQYKDSLEFMKIVYKDSLYKNQSYKNNFTVFCKWLLNSLRKINSI